MPDNLRREQPHDNSAGKTGFEDFVINNPKDSMAKYSRLSSLEENRLRRRSISLIGISLIIFLAFLFWGITGIPRLLSALRDRISPPVITKVDTVPPPPPLIYPLAEATNSASLPAVAGSAEPNATINIKLNGQDLPKTTADQAGQFSVANLTLTEGDNLIQAWASDQAGNTSQAGQEVHITLDTTKPEITVDSPTDGQTFVGVKKQQIIVSGKLNKDATMTLNQRYLVLFSDRSFTNTFSLNEGSNMLTFIATDSAGNTDIRQLTVSYQP
jgi:hypothetical protein